jgi:hypothetical protein
VEAVWSIFEDLLADHLIMRRRSHKSGIDEDSVIEEDNEEEDEDADVEVDDSWSIPLALKKRASCERPLKRARLDSSGSADSAAENVEVEDAGVYWVVNYTQFLRHFRNGWIVDHVTQKLDRTAGHVVKVR